MFKLTDNSNAKIKNTNRQIIVHKTKLKVLQSRFCHLQESKDLISATIGTDPWLSVTQIIHNNHFLEMA